MNLTINSQTLVQELRVLNQIVPVKPALPILANVLINAADGVVHFAATDLEVGLRTSCPATIIEPGSVTLPAKHLLGLTEQFVDTDVQIITEGTHVKVNAGAHRSRLQAMPAEDFPTLPSVEGDPTILQAEAFQGLVRGVDFAISSTGKYIINGALCLLTDSMAALVTTDGKRLALSAMPYTGLATSIIIPAKALSLLSIFSSDITFSYSERHLFFHAGNRLLISRRMEGEFPKYERIIPQDGTKRATIDRAGMAAALRRVGLASDETTLACVLIFEPGQLSLTSQSAEVGDADEQLPILYEGDPITVRCNWRSVLDFLDAATGQTITISMKEAGNPLLFEDGPAYLNVVMTMRT